MIIQIQTDDTLADVITNNFRDMTSAQVSMNSIKEILNMIIEINNNYNVDIHYEKDLIIINIDKKEEK